MTEPLSVESFGSTHFAPKERAALEVLLQNDVTLTQDLVNAVWGPNSIEEHGGLSVLICYLRQKVAPHQIKAVRKRGYRFIRK